MTQIYRLDEVAVADERREYRALSLEANVINELTQVRRTKPADEETARMMESFIQEGQLVPGILAVLTAREASQYVNRINYLWNTNHQLRKMKRVRINGVVHYLILVAGHMRHQTGQKLFEQYQSGALSSLGKFNARYYAELRYGLTADEAIRLQIHENIRNQLHDADEVYAAWLVWEWKRYEDSSFTKTELARMFSRTTGWVREALLFMELPEQIQELAFPSNGNRPTVLKTLLVQVAWYADQRVQAGFALSEEEKLHEVARAVASGMTPLEYREQAKQKLSYLTNDNGVQGNLLDDFKLDEAHTRRPIRRVAAQQMLRSALAARSYFQKLRELRELGGFGTESPYDPMEPGEVAEYSVGSPVRMIGEMARLLRAEADHFEVLARRHDHGRGRPLIEENRPGLDRTIAALSSLEQGEEE